MSNSKENYRQAIATRQGRKVLKGDTIGYTDDEVREKGRQRIRRGVAGGLLATAGVTLALVTGAAKQDQVNANQVKADKAEAARILSNPGPGLTVTEGAPVASVPVAPESTASASPESEPASTDEATTPAAAPTEGAWTPTPGTETASTPATEPYQGGQTTPDTGGLPAEPAGPETGGVAPK